MLMFKAVKSNYPDSTPPTPRQIYDRNAELVQLRQVRRGWRNLIDSEPYLWNSIAFIMGDPASMESASMFLKYSRTATIHLYGFGGSSALDASTRKPAHVLKKRLQAASGRIVSFHIIKPNQAMLRLWPPSAPNLEEMIIETTTPFPAVFRGEMPLLRSIVSPVINTHLYLTAQNLASLTLYPPYTFRTLLGILKNTPMLRRLELRRIFLSAREELPLVPLPLPYLEDLSLSSCFYRIIDHLDFPAQTRITVSIPEYLERRIPWTSTRLVSSAFVPPTFAHCSTLTITAYETRGPAEIRIESQDAGGGRESHFHVGFSEDSSTERRYNTCLLVMGMIRPTTSVYSLRLDVQVGLPAKFAPWLKGFSSLKELSLNGRHISPILRDLASVEGGAFSSLKRATLDGTFIPIYQGFQYWVVSWERAGNEIARDPAPVEHSR